MSERSRNSRVLVMTMADGLAWQVVRSLWLSGVTPYVMGQLPGSVIGRATECAGYHCFSTVKRDGTKLDLSMMDEVVGVAEQLNVDTIMAADFVTNWLLSRWMENGDTRNLGVPTSLPETVVNLHDKWQLTKVLSNLSLPYPESELATCPEDVLATRLEFPIISKPLDLASSKGVQLHRSREELVRTVESGQLFDVMPLIVQRFIPGDDIGYSFLAQNGKVLVSALCRQLHRGVRQYFTDWRMDRYVEALLGAANYSGVGHIDARYDQEKDEYRILEVNPRFWASVLYVTRAGVNFPSYLLRLKYGEPLPTPILKKQPINMSVYERMVTHAVRAIERNYFSRGLVQ